MLDLTRHTMPTIPEDLSEYARVHTGPGSWSADKFECVSKTRSNELDFKTPRAPFVEILPSE